MKRLKTIMATVVVAAMSSCSGGGHVPTNGNGTAEESKDYITQAYDVGMFSAIAAAGDIDIIYTQQEGAAQVEAYGAENIVALLDIHVADSTLVIGFKKEARRVAHRTVEVRVASNTLCEISLSGAGDITFAKALAVETLAINISGNGNVQIARGITARSLTVSIAGSGSLVAKDVSCDNFASSVSGTGDVQIEGHTTSAAFRIAGAGNVDAGQFVAEEVEATVNGAGNIRCYATATLASHHAGTGSIENVAP